ncbi:MAG TPA: FAD-binding oxidoreductase [Thermoplasmata archaeon]|jgi:glycine/D-amino acid oxidase-like deaminating enzyme|nr:FAD-binding oxidoreductase [Thermoplasmata archaeon]
MPGSKRKTADVVVVGGGCMGTSIAWHLARAGVDVVLLERGYIGGGSTGHSGALIRRHYEHPVGIRLAHESLRFFETFRARTGHEAGYVRAGFTTGARSPDVPALRRLVELQREHHVATSLVAPQDLRTIEPSMAVDDLALGAYDDHAGYADPVATALGFAHAASEAGAEVHEHIEVRRVLREKARVVGVTGKAVEIRARRVVLAAGNGTPALAGTAAVRLPIRFIRGEVAILRRPPDFGPPPKLHFDYYHNTYSRPDGTRDTLVGYLSTDLKKAVARPEPFDGTLRESTAKDLRSRLGLRFPGMRRAQLRGGWVGLYDVTPDRYPVLGACGPKGLFVAAGFSGHGFKLAPAVGRLVADAVLGTPSDPLRRALAPSRFRQGRRLKPLAPFPARGARLP